MGTSINQSSPRTLNWSAAQAGYQNDLPLDRVVQEIWRAATNQPVGNIADLLSEPIIARLGQIAIEGNTAVQVAMRATGELARSKQANFATEIAHRAATQCVQSKDRVMAYTERLFAEACNYLVSRDLPGFVGAGNRNATVADSLAFKAAIIRETLQVVRQGGHADLTSQKSWREYVQKIVGQLNRRTI